MLNLFLSQTFFKYLFKGHYFRFENQKIGLQKSNNHPKGNSEFYAFCTVHRSKLEYNHTTEVFVVATNNTNTSRSAKRGSEDLKTPELRHQSFFLQIFCPGHVTSGGVRHHCEKKSQARHVLERTFHGKQKNFRHRQSANSPHHKLVH